MLLLAYQQQALLREPSARVRRALAKKPWELLPWERQASQLRALQPLPSVPPWAQQASQPSQPFLQRASLQAWVRAWERRALLHPWAQQAFHQQHLLPVPLRALDARRRKP